MERLFDSSKLTLEERKKLEEAESEIQKARREMLESAPDHLIELGQILRRAVEGGGLEEFREFLREHDVGINPDLDDNVIMEFRDLLIIQRVDLKDLEPDARRRLRRLTLLFDNPKMKTPDYAAIKKNGEAPRCRDCKWFVTAPKDGGQNSDKSCVELGTKGADEACYGFTVKTGN